VSFCSRFYLFFTCKRACSQGDLGTCPPPRRRATSILSPASGGASPQTPTGALPLNPAGGLQFPRLPFLVPLSNSWLRPCLCAADHISSKTVNYEWTMYVLRQCWTLVTTVYLKDGFTLSLHLHASTTRCVVPVWSSLECIHATVQSVTLERTAKLKWVR